MTKSKGSGIFDGELMGVIVGLLAFSVIFGVKCNQDYPNDNKPTPQDVQETQKQIRRVLKDPAMVDRIVEQFKDIKATQELFNDPDIKKNLQRLTDAVLGAKGSPEQGMKELRERKDLLDDMNPGNWANKAVKGKSGQKSQSKTE